MEIHWPLGFINIKIVLELHLVRNKQSKRQYTQHATGWHSPQRQLCYYFNEPTYMYLVLHSRVCLLILRQKICKS